MIIDTLAVAALLLSLGLLIPILIFSVECWLAVAGSRQALPGRLDLRPRTTVLIPAHNEMRSIRGVIHDVRRQLQPNDRILVVADNCDDNTAQLAEDAGAQVAVRRDTSRLGKAHALALGLKHLAEDPPQVVIVIDADCQLAPGALAALSSTAMKTSRPVQASYTFDGGNGEDINRIFSSMAIYFKNHIRPLGLSRLGLSCQLTGCGMAFPWHTLQGVPVDNGALTEDTQLGIDLLLAGHPPVFCCSAQVSGVVPMSWSTQMGQRRRWEHGYLVTIFSQVPRLVAAGLLGLRPEPILAALDLLVPPLALLGILWVMATIFSAALLLTTGTLLPFLLQLLSGLLMAITIFFGWAAFCRDRIPLHVLFSARRYIARKIPLYCSFLWNRQKVWLRTDRD